MSEEIVRVMRIIIYEGPRNWVEDTVAKSIKGTRNINDNPIKRIHAHTINEFPEILQKIEQE
jgi:hypothetical protein